MLAAQITAPRRFEIIETAEPNLESERDGSVLIRTNRSALCGSDMPAFAAERPAGDYPLAPGLSMHECIGVIAATRSRRFKEGDTVVSIPRAKNGLAEYFLADEAATVALVDSRDEDAMLISQPLGTIIWACRKLENLLNQHTVVLGQGPMGLLMTRMLSNMGAKTVIGMDLLDYRLAVSHQMGATHTINPTDVDPVEAVIDITGGALADLVVEMVGHQTETISECLKLVRRGGTVVAFGVPDEKVYGFQFSDFFRKNIHLIGAVGQEVQSDIPLAIDLIKQGRIDVAPIITHHLPFTEAQLGFELSLHKRDGAIKVFFEYD
ncbi:MAG: zinc-binding dehydrogenase [Acidiferrobacterales bacterium]